MLKFVLYLLFLTFATQVLAHPQSGWTDNDSVFVTITRTHYSCPCDGSVTSGALPWLNLDSVWPTGKNGPHSGIGTPDWKHWNTASVSAILSTEVVTSLTIVTVSGNPVTVLTTQTITYVNNPTGFSIMTSTATSTTTPGGAIVSPILGSTTTSNPISQSNQPTSTSNGAVMSPILGSTTTVGTLLCSAAYTTVVTSTYITSIVYRGVSTTYLSTIVSSESLVSACDYIPTTTYTPSYQTQTQTSCPGPSISISTAVSTITYYSNGVPDRYNTVTSYSIVKVTPTCNIVVSPTTFSTIPLYTNTNACTETPYYATYLSNYISTYTYRGAEYTTLGENTQSFIITPYCLISSPIIIISPVLPTTTPNGSVSECSAPYTTTYETRGVSTYDYRGFNYSVVSTHTTTAVVTPSCACGTPYTTTYEVPQTTTYDYRGFTYTVSQTYTGTQTVSPSCDCATPYTTSYEQYVVTSSYDTGGNVHTYTTIYTGYEYISPACSGRPDATSTIGSGPISTTTTATASSTTPYAVLATFRVRGGPNGDITPYAELGYIPTTSDTGYTNFNNATDLYTIDNRNQIMHLGTGHIAAVPGNTILSHFLFSSPAYIAQNGRTILSCRIDGYYDSGNIFCDAGNGINALSTQNGNLFIGPSVPPGYYSVVLHADVT